MSKIDIIGDIVSKLQYFAKLYSINSLFIIGDYCREKLIGNLENINNIDVVSAYPKQTLRICGLFASEILKLTPTYYNKYGSGFIKYDNVKIEFQGRSINSYMKEEAILKWMNKKAVENTPLLNNVYGRDFTINSLLMSLENGEMYDLTSRSIDDIKNKKIDSTISPKLLTSYNPISILRAIKFACQYDFKIDPELRYYMKKYGGLIFKTYSKERITLEIEKILKLNAKEGIKHLQKYNLVSAVIPKHLQKYLDPEGLKNEKH